MRSTDHTRWLLPLGALVCALPFVPAPIALILGAALGVGVGHPHGARVRRLTPKLLAVAVVGLGAGIDLREVARVGAEGALMTLATIALCLGLGALLTRALGVSARLGLLISVGTAICGGSAIAAVAPAVHANDDETSVALGTVFMLNAVALVVLPLVGHALGLTPERFGVYAALAVHDTSSVVGAAMSFGERAVEIATTVKLARATWIVPVALAASMRFASPAKGSDDAPITRERPWFIVAFALCAALFTFVPGLEALGAAIAWLAKRAMVVTLFLVGAGMSRAALGRAGVRPLLLGVTLWIVVACASLGLVMA